jgi:hypothetical protein
MKSELVVFEGYEIRRNMTSRQQTVAPRLGPSRELMETTRRMWLVELGEQLIPGRA